jgi:hypothetical protein
VTEPVFPTKWHFLTAEVLIGVEEATGRILLQHGQDGGPTLPMWTGQDHAAQALPAGHALRHCPASERLAELPPGISITVDGGLEQGMFLPAGYVQELKPLAVPFPAGSTFRRWVDLPEATAEAVRAAAARYGFLRRVWALLYTVQDSPYRGCLVYEADGGPEGSESVVDALSAALDATTDLGALQVLGVQIIAFGDVPEDLVPELVDEPPLYRSDG